MKNMIQNCATYKILENMNLIFDLTEGKFQHNL